MDYLIPLVLLSLPQLLRSKVAVRASCFCHNIILLDEALAGSKIKQHKIVEGSRDRQVLGFNVAVANFCKYVTGIKGRY